MFGLKLTPETVILLPLAISIDTMSIVLVCFGFDDFFILDIAGMVAIGGWLLLSKRDTSLIKGKKGNMNKIKKLFRDKKSRFLITTGGELVPYLGIFPFWTISVFMTLSE